MRHTIEITRHNCPRDGDSITAEVTLDVGDGTVTHVGTRIVRWDLDDWQYENIPGCTQRQIEAGVIAVILERDCDPVTMAMDKLRAADLSTEQKHGTT